MPRLALAGDAVLAGGVGARLLREPPTAVVAPELLELLRDADLFVLNLEGGVSAAGEPWPGLHRIWYRAPPEAVDLLALLGVDCVTLANNHMLDYGVDALLDTIERMHGAGIATAGAAVDRRGARAPAWLRRRRFPPRGALGLRPRAAVRGRVADARDRVRGSGPRRARLARAHRARRRLPRRCGAREPALGPELDDRAPDHVRRAVPALRAAGATLVAGHSAHVFHGVEGPVLYDLGNFLDDFFDEGSTAPDRRSDRSLLWFVDLGPTGPTRLEAVPVIVRECRTDLARGDDRAWVATRFRRACAALGTEVREEDGRLVVTW